MAARGTRRPHARRPYKRPRKSTAAGKGCALFLLALAALPATLAADVIWAWWTR